MTQEIKKIRRKDQNLGPKNRFHVCLGWFQIQHFSLVIRPYQQPHLASFLVRFC